MCRHRHRPSSPWYDSTCNEGPDDNRRSARMCALNVEVPINARVGGQLTPTPYFFNTE